MFPLDQPHFVANGNVAPCRFIAPVVSSTGGAKAVQASSAAALILGVSTEATRNAPGGPADDGYCAIAGEPLTYRGPGQIANLTLGGTVSSANTLLTTDSDGKGIAVDDTSDAKIFVAAIALQPGVAGDKVPVYVLSPTYQMAVHQ